MRVRARRIFAAFALAFLAAALPSAALARGSAPGATLPPLAASVTFSAPAALSAAVTLSAAAATPVPTSTPAPNSWYWPMNHIVKAPAPGWLQYRTGYSVAKKAWHLAWDDCTGKKAGMPVYSPGYGRVVISRMDISGYGPGGSKGGALVVRYRTTTGAYFNALFGHIVIDLKKFPVGTLVKPGQVIAKLNKYNPPHLHFGIRKGTGFPKPLRSTPKKLRSTVSMLMGHTFEYSKDASGNLVPQTYGFVDPAAWLIARSPWRRVPAAPSKPSAPSRARKSSTFTVRGSLGATRVVEPVSITVIGERLEKGAWVNRAHWHGTVAKIKGAAAKYSARVRVKAKGMWRFSVRVHQTMDWTGGLSTPSRQVTIH